SLHLIVVRATDKVDELGVGTAQHGAAIDQPTLVEAPGERQRARLGDDRLVEIEECGRGGRGSPGSTCLRRWPRVGIGGAFHGSEHTGRMRILPGGVLAAWPQGTI